MIGDTKTFFGVFLLVFFLFFFLFGGQATLHDHIILHKLVVFTSYGELSPLR